MKPIKNPPPPPLGPGSAPDAIANLQDALLLVLANGRVQLADEERAALRDERQREEYRDATSRAVIAFREQQGLEPGEIVDERTAERLNALLGELGALETRSRESRHLISGKVQQEGGKPLGNVLVRAFHQVDGGLVRLGEDMADSAGHYTIAYTPPPEVDNITLLVRAFSEDGKSLEPSRYVSEAKPLEIVDLTMAAAVAARSDRILEGRIVFDNSLPAEGLNLRLYRVDFGGEATQLAETTTRELGLYDFPVFDFRGKAGALQIRAVNAEGIEQPLSKVIHDLGEEPRIIVNLVAETSLKPPAAEYQRLESAIAPQIGELRNLVDARETSDRRDLTLLNRATGWDARLIALAANAENLSTDEEVALPSEAVYGLLRAGLPSDKLQLAQVDPEVVAQVLTNVKDAGIVSLADTSIEEVKEQFSGFADRVRLGVTAPGSQATYRDLLGASGLEEDAQKKFASVYLKHRGDIDQLWRNSREAGLDDAAVKKLQLQGKLAFLTGNSVSMTRRLQDRLSTPEELVEQDYFLPSKWEEEVKAVAAVSADFNIQEPSESDRQKLEALIPSAYTGATLEKRLHAYGEDMARKVRLAYPTQVLGRRLERDSVNAFQLGEGRSSTIALLKNAVAAGFRLGETPVHTFFQENSAVLNTIENVETAKQNLTTLQRLSQITPSDDGVPVLMKLGFTSAYDVVALPEKDFIELYGSASTGITEARLIYRKAQQVSSVTYNLFTIAKTLDSEPALAAISGTPVQHAEAKEKLREALKNYPTMESLFGSTDFCECEHCRSVLSPAAYLVDLLQFIDTEPLVWGNFLAKWKKTHSNQEYTAKYKKPYDALIERRPDIPYISLTCENTNTALPYIDVVNEILEYYVSNSSLSEKAARNTGQTTTAELLAEPQNIISAAYNKLQQARYPLALPFDLWVETVRQFCDYFETPFWKLLEIFCPHSDLFAPTQPFDLASIFAEQLGLSPAELAIFANPAPLANWHQLYGYETEAEAATQALDPAGQRIDLNSAKALARRLGITY
ncbi:MAG TPA: Tc toxin subunit A, partial [Terrimicrobiaceae bacterium]